MPWHHQAWRIFSLLKLIVIKLDFINYNCVAEVEASRQEVVGSIASEFSTYDKKRIEAESIYERNKRVFIGGVILIFGLGLIMTFKKSKK